MQRLVDAIIASIDPVSLMRRVAEQTCLFTPHASGAAVSLCAPDGSLVIVSAHGAAGPQLGQVVPPEQTFSALALQHRRPQVIDDVAEDDQMVLAARALALELGVRSCVAIPLLHNDTAIGVLTATGARPGAFSAADVAALDSMSRLVAALIGSHREVSRLLGELFDSDPSSSDHAKTEFLAELMIPGHADDSRLHTVLDTIMEPGGIQPVFQPIVDLHTRATVAVEGLCRFPRAPQFSTAEWFSCARRLRRGIDLEVTAVQSVLTASQLFPTDLPIAVNLSPLAALEPAVHAMLAAADRTLIVEITEHEPFPASLGEQLQPLRDNGIRLAIDDAGAGYASMAEILRLRPDIIKIDGQLTTDIDADPVRRALTYSLVRLAGEIGASTVAEAVETSAQHCALQATGVLLGQGYFFGKPTPAPHITLAPSEA